MIINLTPHKINFVSAEGGPLMEIEPSGVVARVSTETRIIDVIEDLPVTRTFFGEVEGLPEPEPGTIYIVSSLVAQRVQERTDVFIPNESVRDESGRIIGCKSLGRIS